MGNDKRIATLLTCCLLICTLSVAIINTAHTGLAETINDANVSVDIPILAPSNPDFVSYQKAQISSDTKMKSALSRTTVTSSNNSGLIPSPVDLGHINNEAPGVGLVPLESKYDLRTLGRVTSVKNQSPALVCWAFAAYGSLESFLMPKENFDFSENNMKNLLSSRYPDGYDRTANDGGNQFMSTAYLARWSGPVRERLDPYNGSSLTSSTNLPIEKHVQNVFFLPQRRSVLDNEKIKQSIKEYGGVTADMYMEPNVLDNPLLYNSTTFSYYYNATLEGISYNNNHAVTLVGWDNNYNKNNFSRFAPANGAFIAKNEWGTSFGDNGYFYISYYDTNIGRFASPLDNDNDADDNAEDLAMMVYTAENTSNYQHIYQYDPLGWTSSLGYYDALEGENEPNAWSSNSFTAIDNDSLTAVSFYATDDDTKYEIYVGSSLTTRTLYAHGTTDVAGYHTIVLDRTVPLRTGQKFYVILNLTTDDYDYPIALEYPWSYYSSKAVADPGQSFISPNGTVWSDITQSYPLTNVCIKAFTSDIPIALPVAFFRSNVTEGSVPLTVQFRDLSTNATGRVWNFGDGSPTNTTANPIHTFIRDGTFLVTLIASANLSNGTTVYSTYSKTIEVEDDEDDDQTTVANFIGRPLSGIGTLNVQFADRSIDADSWFYNFGDGNSSLSRNPQHLYGEPGSYTVAQIVYNSTTNHYDAMIKKDYVNIASPNGEIPDTDDNIINAPTVDVKINDFYSTATSGVAPLRTVFYSNVTGIENVRTWTWIFEPSGDEYYSMSPSSAHHIFNHVGTFDITLILTNKTGAVASLTKTAYINVTAPLEPRNSIEILQEEPEAGESYTDSSSQSFNTSDDISTDDIVSSDETTNPDETVSPIVTTDSSNVDNSVGTDSSVNVYGFVSHDNIIGSDGDTVGSNITYSDIISNGSGSTVTYSGFGNTFRAVVNDAVDNNTVVNDSTIDNTINSTIDSISTNNDISTSDSAINLEAPITATNTDVITNADATNNGLINSEYASEPSVSVVSESPTTFTVDGQKNSGIKFESQIKTDFVSVTWNFQDGWGSHEINPTHTYKEDGIYAVTLTVNGLDGSVKKKVVGTVVIK